MTATDRILSGQQMSYTCAAAGTMLPETSDPDSNFAMEVECVAGSFPRPSWPENCITEDVCTVVPTPPSSLVRKDERAKFRAGESAYFVCADAEAVLDDESGMRLFELKCASGSFPNDQWPTCIVEPTCSDLPVPTEASGMVKATVGDKVKMGENVVYECARRDIYFETPNVSSGFSVQSFQMSRSW